MVVIRKVFMKKGRIPERTIEIKSEKWQGWGRASGEEHPGEGKNMFKGPEVRGSSTDLRY